MTWDSTTAEFVRAEVSGIAYLIKCEVASIANELRCPSAVYRPRLSIDGDQWCALYGENLQDGVAGFGDSPCLALGAFDIAWATRIAKPVGQERSQEEIPGTASKTIGWVA